MRLLAALALAGTAVLVGPAPASQAAETGTQTETFSLGDLDESGSGTFDQFDPSLGTLTAVALTADVTMNFTVCITNLSEEAASVNSGSATGSSSVAFAGDVVAEGTGQFTVPAIELAASEGLDGCDAWEGAGGDPEVAPDGANSQLVTDSASDSWSTTLTDAAQLAPYIGTGTVGFDYEASSLSDLAQPSEWTLVFLAGGEGEVSVTYTYTEGDVGGICEDNSTADECDEGEVGGIQDLPDTGGPIGWLMPLGVGLAFLGAVLAVAARRPHSA